MLNLKMKKIPDIIWFYVYWSVYVLTDRSFQKLWLSWNGQYSQRTDDVYLKVKFKPLSKSY